MKVSNIRFHGNQSSGPRVDTCGQTDLKYDGATGAFRKYAKAPEKTRNYVPAPWHLSLHINQL